MAKSRYIGDYPAIGIRPIIDGRRGPMQLRENLEDQVLAMALAAKKLFEDNLRYSNGDPVRVVVADSSIGRVPESAACAEKFRREGVAITLSVTPCWCYGSETMDMDPMTIKGVWGFNGTERPGAVYLASVLATHAQKGLPAFGIYGHEVQDRDQVTCIPDDVKEKLLRFGRAAIAAATMRGKSYLQIGSMCMGIGGSIIDQQFMEEYLGLRVEAVDEVEILRRMEEGIYDHAAYERALAWTKEHCKEGRDDNPEFVQFLGEKRRIKFTAEEKEKKMMSFRRRTSMKNILFICHGNICRSPMAEFVMKDLVKNTGFASQFHIESAATSREEIGNPVYPPARRKLAEHGISCGGHAARQLTNQDYDKYDLLIGMDSANLRNMHRICGGDFAGKLHLLMDYTDHPRDVADPWYTEDFEATWQDVLAGCRGLLSELTTRRCNENG